MVESLTPARLALVGVGGYGETHLAVIERLSARGLCRLEAGVIRDPERHPEAADRLGRAGVASTRRSIISWPRSAAASTW